MAKFKRIADIEVVEKNNNMNVLVDDAGAFKKVSVNNLGGSNIFILKETEEDVFEANMSYEELRSAVLNDTLSCAFYKSRPYTEAMFFDYVSDFYVLDNCIEIYRNIHMSGSYGHAPVYYYYPDGSIIFNDSVGLGGGIDGSGAE